MIIVSFTASSHEFLSNVDIIGTADHVEFIVVYAYHIATFMKAKNNYNTIHKISTYIMQIVHGGKVVWMNRLLPIHWKTFTVHSLQ